MKKIMEKMLIIRADRECYSAEEAARGAMTVNELIEYLEWNCDGDEKVVLSHDNGYTYGHINTAKFEN